MKNIAFIFSLTLAIGLVSAKFKAPLYCSHEEDLQKNRRIPPLKFDKADNPELVQVQTLIRHGARTPAAKRMCWKEYVPEWECDLKEIISTHVPSDDTDEPTFGFIKTFDARPDASILPGNCEKGQLIAEGKKMSQFVGSVVGDAYFKPDAPGFIPKELTVKQPIVDLQAIAENGKGKVVDLGGSVYVRSSDYQRTRLSGSSFMTQLIKETLGTNVTKTTFRVPVHTLDISVDTIFPNEEWCYDLKAVTAKAWASDEYKNSYLKQHADLRKRLEKAIGMDPTPNWPTGVLDCFMTAVCNEEKWDMIPAAISPKGDEAAQKLLNEVLTAVDQEALFYYRWNQSQYSKIALTRYVTDIKANLILQYNKKTGNTDDVFFGDKNQYQEFQAFLQGSTQTKPHDFVLWSAHDSTVMPFLASLGQPVFEASGAVGTRFSPYSSLISLEFYKTTNGPKFRLVYNSKVLTTSVEGCKEDLCSIQNFFKATDWANPTAYKAPCHMKKPPPTCPDVETTSSSVVVVPGVASLLFAAMFAMSQ